jgi:hypothetical protein
LVRPAIILIIQYGLVAASAPALLRPGGSMASARTRAVAPTPAEKGATPQSVA